MECRVPLSEHDPKVKEFIENNKKYNRSHNFGDEAIFTYEYNQEIIKSIETELKALQSKTDIGILSRYTRKGWEDLSEIHEKIERLNVEKEGRVGANDQQLKNTFNTLLYSINIGFLTEDRRRFTLERLRLMFPEVKTEENASDNYLDLKNFLNSIENGIQSGNISQEQMYEALKWHEHKILKEQEYLQEIEQQTKQAFKDLILQAVENGVLPPKAKKSLERLETTDIQILDSFLSFEYFAPAGTHSVWEKTIKINNIFCDGKHESEIKRILFHEFLHAISGNGFVLKNGRVEPKKIGALIGDKYFWLNEAITEWLNIEFCLDGSTKEKSNAPYHHERADLHELFDLGLEKSMVLDAYFEDMPEDKTDHQMQGAKYAKLIRRVNEIKGNLGFLQLEYKYRLRYLEQMLLNYGIFPDDIKSIGSLAPEGRFYTFDIEFGKNPKVQAKKTFYFIATPRAPYYKDAEGKNLPPEKQWEKTLELLEHLKSAYPEKFTYTLTGIELPENKKDLA